MPARLIVVEGLPGSGKSTFSQALTHAFEAAGTNARWYSELELDHPIGHVYIGQPPWPGGTYRKLP
jgi:thymidylate kinase